MSRSVEAILKIKTEGQAELGQIKQAYDAIGSAGGNMARVGQEAFQKLIASGKSYDQALKMISQSEKTLGGAVAGAAKDLLDQAKAISENTKELEKNERAWRSLQKAHASALSEQGRMDKARQSEVDKAQKKVEAEKALQSREQMNLARGAAIGGGASLPGMYLGPTAFAAAVGIGALVGTIKAVKDLAASYAEFSREQSNLAAKTGFSLEQTQLYSRASQVAGVNASAMTTAVRGLSKALAENSDEGKRAKAALKELGLDESIASQNPAVAMSTIFQKLKGVADPMERDRIASTVLSRGGMELLPIAGQLDQLLPKLRMAGVVMDDAGIKKGKEYEEQLQLLGIQWDALKNKIGSGIVGVINFVLKNGGKQRSLAEGVGLGAEGLVSAGAIPLGQMLGEKASSYIFNPQDLPGEIGGIRKAFPNQFAPQTGDPFALMRQQTSDKIQSILTGVNSGDDVNARQGALRRQLKQVQGIDLPAAIDSQNVAGVQAGVSKINGLQQQIKYETEILKIKKETFALDQQATLKPFGSLGGIEGRRRDNLRDLDEQIEQARRAGQTGEVKELTGQRGIRDRLFGNELRTEARSITDRQKTAMSGIDVEVQKSGLERESNRQLRMADLKAGPNGASPDDVSAATQNRLTLVKQLHDIEIDRISKTTFSEDVIANANQKQLELKKADAELAKSTSDIELDKAMKLLEIEERRRKKAEEADKQIEQIGVTSARAGIQRQAGQASRVAKLQLGPGQEGTEIVQAYNQRLSLAKQLYDFELSEAAKEDDVDKRRVDQARALADLKKETADAEMERAEAVLELEKKRVDQFRGISSSIFDSLVKGGNAVQQQFRTFGLNIAKSIFVNIGEEAFGVLKKSGLSLAAPGQTNPDGSLNVIGKALKGTIFGQDQSKIAGDSLVKSNADNTLKTQTNTQSLDSLTQSIQATLQAGGFSPDGTPNGSTPNGTVGGGLFAGLGGGLGPEGVAEGNGAALENLGLTPNNGDFGGETSSPFSSDAAAAAVAGGGVLGGLKGVLSGAASVIPHKNADGTTSGGLFAGIYDNGDMSTAQAIGNVAASAGAIVGGVEGTLKGLQQGGARGATQAASSVLGVASLIPGPQQPFIMAGAVIAGLVHQFLPDPRQERSKEISHTLVGAYNPVPVGESVVEDANSGNQSTTNFRGQLRTLNSAPLLSTYQKVIGINPTRPSNLLTTSERTYNYGSQNDSATLVPNSGKPAAVTNVYVSPAVHVTAMDSKSIVDNHQAIGDAVIKSMQSGGKIRAAVQKLTKVF